MDFATKMRAMRAMRDLSQRELAALTGIPNTYLSDLESGKTLPNPDWERRIRQALGWTPQADTAFTLLAEAQA
jgi:transcriptional regulator with XRE-family HTH domain